MFCKISNAANGLEIRWIGNFPKTDAIDMLHTFREVEFKR